MRIASSICVLCPRCGEMCAASPHRIRIATGGSAAHIVPEFHRIAKARFLAEVSPVRADFQNSRALHDTNDLPVVSGRSSRCELMD